MAVTITPEEVREIIQASFSDELIQCYIDAMEEKMGACVDASYSDSTAKLIKLNMVAYLIAQAEGRKEAQSKRAPNGASVTYYAGVSQNGLLNNQYGRIVFDLDSSGCWMSMVRSTLAFFSRGPKAKSKFPNE